MKTLPREFQLVAACCVWPLSPAAADAVRAKAAQVTDWERFLKVVQRHRVAGLVANAVENAQTALPETIARRLRAAADQDLRQSLKFAAETLRLHTLFEEKGLGVLFVKGATLAKLAYGNIGIKQAWDIDLLVDPGSVLTADTILAEAGYRRFLPPPDLDAQHFARWVGFAKEAVFQNPHRGITVELHWRLTDNPLLLPGVCAASPARLVALTGAAGARTLETQDLFSYLCVHGALHAWGRLKWLADLAALLATLPSDRLPALYRASQTKGAGRAPAQALLLCRDVLNLALPPELERELRRDARTRRLERLALFVMAGDGGIAEVDNRWLAHLLMHSSHFLLGRGARFAAAELRAKMVGWTDFTSVTLPEGLHFLYPLIRGPSWLWRRVLRPRP